MIDRIDPCPATAAIPPGADIQPICRRWYGNQVVLVQAEVPVKTPDFCEFWPAWPDKVSVHRSGGPPFPCHDRITAWTNQLDGRLRTTKPAMRWSGACCRCLAVAPQLSRMTTPPVTRLQTTQCQPCIIGKCGGATVNKDCAPGQDRRLRGRACCRDRVLGRMSERQWRRPTSDRLDGR